MKDKAILTLKALAIIGVIFQHIGNRRFGATVLDEIAVMGTAFSWCVLAFFATSGWLHGFGADKKPKAIGEFVKSRATRLLVPYLALVVLYSCLWGGVFAIGVTGLRGAIASSFLARIWESIPPSHGREVAEQLYFLPLLFFVSTLVHLALRLGGTCGIGILCAASFLTGLILFPHSGNTGFSAGVFVWGTFCYTSGFLLFRSKGNRWGLWLVAGAAVATICVAGWGGGLKVIAVAFVALMHRLRFDAVPLLPQIGEASGTIYAYHTPFVLQPLVIAATRLPSAELKFVGALVSSFLALGICMAGYYWLRNTRWRFVLM